MFCPNCGEKTSGEQKFCRACGLSLQAVAQVLAEELRAPGVEDCSKTRGLGFSKLEYRVLVGGFLLMMLGAIVGIIGKKIIMDSTVIGAGALYSLIGIAIMCFPFLRLFAPHRRRPAPSTETLPPKTAADLGAAPLLAAVPPSVTEHTTRQLEDAPLAEPPRDTNPTLNNV